MPATGSNKGNPKSVKSVSIRLRSGGLSFFYEDAKGRHELSAALRDGGSVSAQSVEQALRQLAGLEPQQVGVWVDTADVLYVPQPLLEAERAPEDLLRQAAIRIPAHHRIIVTESERGVCALYTVHEDICRLFAAYGGGVPVRWYAPMHELLTACRRAVEHKDCYAVYPTPDNLHVVQFDRSGRLLLCETYPCRSEAEAVYVMSELTGASADNASDGAGASADYGTDVSADSGAGAAAGRKSKIYLYGDGPVRYAKVLKRYFPRTRTI